MCQCITDSDDKLFMQTGSYLFLIMQHFPATKEAGFIHQGKITNSQGYMSHCLINQTACGNSAYAVQCFVRYKALCNMFTQVCVVP